MAAKKFLRNVAGTITEIVATVTSSGATNDGDLVALDANGKLDNSLLPTGIGADTAIVLASEALSAGNFVNVYNNSGTANVRKADASVAGKRAHGFVLASVASGANATVYFEGTNNGVTGQTPGDVFLSASTPGVATSTAPSASGQLVQRVGVAVSATSINAELDGNPIVLA